MDVAQVQSSHSEKMMEKHGPDAVKSKEYWDNVEPTVDGMLGGFSRIHHADMDGSRKFLRQFFRSRSIEGKKRMPSQKPVMKRSIDCGAGIGRITRHLLLDFSEQVDLLEQSQVFLDRVTEYIGQANVNRIGNKYCHSLQSFVPDDNTVYDCVWLQWVTGYLTDVEFVEFLVKMSKTLHPDHGVIIIKDNTTRGDDEDTDMNDSSVTRPKNVMLDIFKKAGLQVVLEQRQLKLPRGLYPVYMFALKQANQDAI